MRGLARQLLPLAGMIEGLYSRGSIGALDSLLQFAGARHRVIAGNIAHVDTVGYQAMDLPTADFEASLAKAWRGQGPWPGGEATAVASTDAGMLKPNGNNVDLDIEMGRMVKNQSLYTTAAALLAQQFALLRSAIAERVL